MKPRIPTSTEALAGWTVICLRAASEQAAAARVIRARGARALALPGFRVEPLPAQRALADACSPAPDLALFISPVAVRHGIALRPTLPAEVACAGAVGVATARALREAGFTGVIAPAQAQPQTSEGLLLHPDLQTGAGRRLLLLGAPGGRGLLAPSLEARGFAVQTIDVYRRVAARLDARQRRLLEQCEGRIGLLLSSAEALDNVLAQLGPEQRQRLQQAQVAASSQRLLELARARGFNDLRLAAGPVIEQLLAALDQPSV